MKYVCVRYLYNFLCFFRFGSGNMCDLLNDNSLLLFGHSSVTSSDLTASSTSSSATTAIDPTRRKRSFLELGSGIGRAGIMAAKLMNLYDTFDACVLTDGK